MSGDVSLDYSAVSKLSLRLKVAQAVAPAKMNAWLDSVGDELAEVMRQKAPVRSGNLVNHIAKVSEPGRVRVGIYDVPYARYVIEGTDPHEIKPKNASVLVFKIGNKTVFARRVRHPGTKANPFMADSVKQVLRDSKARLSGLKFGIGPNGK